MKFKEFKFVFISLDYLRELHEADSEVFYKDDPLYEKKPHLGVLINNEGRRYVIPLTSAKDKHKDWDDVTATHFIIFEIINTKTAVVDDDDIVTDIKNTQLLRNKGILEEDYYKYKKRILSVLELRKMIPVKDDVFRYADLKTTQGLDKDELQRRKLMYKEYSFCLNIKDKIEQKANKIYSKQMQTGKVLKYYCDFKKLEKASDEYDTIHKE